MPWTMVSGGHRLRACQTGCPDARDNQKKVLGIQIGGLVAQRTTKIY